MSGLRKAKKYDWKDSNLAMFGSDTEKKVKKESAETEEAWRGAGQTPGLQIWRVVKFKITHWPKEDYGKLFNGDSYIILKTNKDPETESLSWDVHFWIGQYSTQDEYGTAAYKTVELDTFLNDGPIQHREVQNHESDMFKSYFNSLTIMEGGADTGFRHVAPESYQSRLLHFKGERKRVIVKEVPLIRKSMNSGDVFILDLGLQLYQWNGKDCNKDEKFKAMQYMQQLKSDRHGKPKAETLDEDEIGPNHRFYDNFKEDDVDSEDDSAYGSDHETEKKLLRLSDALGEMVFSVEKEGDFTKDALKSEDVFIVDTGKGVFVWIGKDASIGEKRNGMTYAHNHLMSSKHPLQAVTVVREDQRCDSFEDIFGKKKTRKGKKGCQIS